MSMRPQKSWRMSYWGTPDGDAEPHISLLGDPGEIRLGVGGKTFIGVKEDGINISGGFPSKINIQGLSHNMGFGGMIRNQYWPFNMIPSTVATPNPQQVIAPPMVEIVPLLTQISIIATSMAGF